LIKFISDIGLDLAEKCGRLFGDLHKNISTVAVSMDEVVLHQHFKESSSSQSSNHGI